MLSKSSLRGLVPHWGTHVVQESHSFNEAKGTSEGYLFVGSSAKSASMIYIQNLLSSETLQKIGLKKGCSELPKGRHIFRGSI